VCPDSCPSRPHRLLPPTPEKVPPPELDEFRHHRGGLLILACSCFHCLKIVAGIAGAWKWGRPGRCSSAAGKSWSRTRYQDARTIRVTGTPSDGKARPYLAARIWLRVFRMPPEGSTMHDRLGATYIGSYL
jgi:hypothetical protein